MKIAFSGMISGDAVRGIGVHTKELIDNLQKLPEIEIVLSGYDVIHYTKFNPFFLSLPLIKPNAKVVLTIHDLIPLIYPKQYPPGIKGKLIFFLQKILVNQVDAIITISETSKKDICRFLAVQPDKVHVIYLAPRKIFRPITTHNIFNLPDKFVLYVGDVNYNKNISTLAEAAKIAQIPLVIVGKQAAEENFDRNHIENQSFIQFLDKYSKDKDIIRLGFVEDEDLVKIYNLATVYCQPSFYEGFGLPILEAMACGTPVVAAKNNCHIEIGGDAVLLADPKSAEDLAEKFNMVMKDEKLRHDLITKGFARVKDFSWEKTARETFQVYGALARSAI